MNNRSKGQSCPYCSHRKVLSGFNDLATTHPELVASEWDWELNEADGILPSLVFAGSSGNVMSAGSRMKHKLFTKPKRIRQTVLSVQVVKPLPDITIWQLLTHILRLNGIPQRMVVLSQQI